MSVSKEEIVNLHRRIDDHKKETKSDISELINSMKELPLSITRLTIDLREMLVEFRAQKDVIGRIRKEVENIKKDISDSKTRMTIVETKQDGLLGVGAKLMPYAILGLVFASGVLQLYMYTRK